MPVNRNSFIKFVVCSKCHSTYNLDDVLTTIETFAHMRVPAPSILIELVENHACGSQLVARIKLKDDSLRAHPHKMYCYKSLAELELFRCPASL